MTNALQQSVEFYTDVLGFSISRKIEMDEFTAVFIEKGGSIIELMGFKEFSKRPEGIELKIGSIPLNDHISFSVDDIETTATEFKEKGVVFDLEPIHLEGGTKLASFKDPNGVLIELIEHPQ